MYTPTFSLTHKIVKNLINTEISIRDIKTTPLPSSAHKKINSDMLAENIRFIGLLIGVQIDEPESADIAQGKVIPSPESPTVILSNYRSTTDFIYSASSDPYLSLSSSLLIHLNKLLLNTAVESWDIGRFRTITDSVNPTYDTWYEQHPKVELRNDPQRYFTSALNWFSERKHSIHPMLKTACLLYEIYEQYPFVAGNQITFIAAAELLLEKSNLSLRGLFPVARNFYHNQDEYCEVLNRTSQMKEKDLTPWIEIFSKGISTDMASLKNDVIQSTEKKIRTRKKKLVDLNSRQKQALRHLRYNKKLTRRKYVEMTGVSSMTAYRDLDDLVKRKLIIVKGGGRSTYYTVPKEPESTIEEHDDTPKNVVKVISDLNPSIPESTVSDPTDDLPFESFTG